MKLTLPALITCAIAAPIAAQDRMTTEASWSEGTATIEYGAPEWREEFGAAMAEQASWRLGKDGPTRVTLECGLVTADGCVPPGEYGLAMKKNAKGAWDLVVYPGEGYYDVDRPGWKISASSSEQTDKVASALTIALNDNKQIEVAFGPNRAVYPFTPIKLFDPVETEFARIPTKVEIMAVPTDQDMNSVTIGKASIERDGMAVSWTIKFSMQGGEASLAFENERARAIDGDKQRVEAMIERVNGMIEGASDERKSQLEAFLQEQREMHKRLAVEAEQLTRFHPSHKVSGDVSAADARAESLSFESERVDGGMILKLGAGKHVATFKIVPREFLNRNR